MADGRLGKCKGCTKNDVKTRYRKVRPARHEYERQRYQTASRKRQVVENMRRHRESNPDKYRARNAVNNAIRDGRLKRGKCEKQPCKAKAQAHHEDYSKPLQVRWLCHKHHQQEHGKLLD